MATKKLPKKTPKKSKAEAKASAKKTSPKKLPKRVLPADQPLFEVRPPQKIDPAESPLGVTLFIDLSELSAGERSLRVSRINQFLLDVEADVLIALAKIPNEGGP